MKKLFYILLLLSSFALLSSCKKTEQNPQWSVVTNQKWLSDAESESTQVWEDAPKSADIKSSLDFEEAQKQDIKDSEFESVSFE